LSTCAAIVSDEGGIMCHAAVVARELKKTCVIGTKVATKVLHDGDLVEVDADNGIVRVLEKNKDSNDEPQASGPSSEDRAEPKELFGIKTDAYQFFGLWKCNLFAHW
ncbi:MAG: PEP-utilizing enzyme, partial [Pseudomonadota bacterium]